MPAEILIWQLLPFGMAQTSVLSTLTLAFSRLARILFSRLKIRVTSPPGFFNAGTIAGALWHPAMRASRLVLSIFW